MKIRHRSDRPEAQRDDLPPLEDKALVKYGIVHALKTFVMIAAVMAILYAVLVGVFPNSGVTREVEGALVSPELWMFILIGVAAQAVDGALGMAYGVTANSLLLGVGVPPAASTAAVHLSEVFTTGFSGFSHWRMGNFNRSLFLKLLIPGTIGAVAGAYLVSIIDGAILKPFISAYLLIMGIYILRKAFVHHAARKSAREGAVAPLALFGGFVDSVGGGGWGPVVTTTLLGRGHAPKETIGSVNSAEFFLTIASATAFAALVGFGYWTAIVGLVIGGVFAAPFAAWLCQHLSTKQLLVMVGVLISGLSVWNLYNALF
ncbi:MAG: sulfite exporter TauE/SafE family protein [Moraxellaceae bacterium]